MQNDQSRTISALNKPHSASATFSMMGSPSWRPFMNSMAMPTQHRTVLLKSGSFWRRVIYGPRSLRYSLGMMMSSLKPGPAYGTMMGFTAERGGDAEGTAGTAGAAASSAVNRNSGRKKQVHRPCCVQKPVQSFSNVHALYLTGEERRNNV